MTVQYRCADCREVITALAIPIIRVCSMCKTHDPNSGVVLAFDRRARNVLLTPNRHDRFKGFRT
jgi:hypothetical protein